jgi:hypothetical protein
VELDLTEYTEKSVEELTVDIILTVMEMTKGEE